MSAAGGPGRPGDAGDPVHGAPHDHVHADPLEPGAWLEHARARLAGAGHRAGGARSAVLQVLAEAECCITAQQIHDVLRAAERRVGVASVYRALEQLAGLRLVTRLDFGDGVARFEPADPGGHHHHHLVCTGCGRVAPFEDPELERVIAGTGAGAGFEVQDHEVVLRGRCAACATAAPPPS